MIFSSKLDLPSFFKYCFLRLCLNAFRLVILLISSGTLFHSAGPMKDMTFWGVRSTVSVEDNYA